MKRWSILVVGVAGYAVLTPLASAQYTFKLLGGDFDSSKAYGAGGTQQAGTSDKGGTYGNYASLWEGSPGSVKDLSPGGDYLESGAYSTNGSNQVGWARQGAGGGAQKHAALWAGSAGTFNDLNPVGYASSEAWAVDGAYQIGHALSISASYDHAMLWRGDHDHFDDLHPIDKPVWDSSQALDGAGGQQVGYAVGSPGTHAAMWAGSYTSFSDLHPTGASYSLALATDGVIQGGYAYVGAQHAFLWSGTAASALDINPSGTSSSVVNDIGAGYQVGAAGGHAYRWAGTAGSAYDLHSFVTGGFTSSSAYGIGSDGTIVGFVKFAGGGDFSWACMWTPVPEPMPIVAFVGILAIGLRQNRHRQ